jgi:hypothetical protein
MPVDHRIQHLHDDKRADRLMLQHGLSRVAQAKPADDDLEIDALKCCKTEASQCDIKYSSPSLISKTSTPSDNSRRLRRLSAPIGVGR